MKRILIGITILGVGGALVFNVIQGNRSDYVAGTATSTSEVLLPEWASDTEAVEAAQAVMRKKALTEEINGLEGEISTLTATYDAELTRLTEEKTIREKELGSFWTDKANIKAEIRKTFSQDPINAVAIAGWESGGYNPKAYNPEWHYDRNGNKLCQGSFGLMQVACVHNIEDPEALFDVEFNLAVAKRVYNDSLERRGNGWLPWGAYTDNGYKNYLTML